MTNNSQFQKETLLKLGRIVARNGDEIIVKGENTGAYIGMKDGQFYISNTIESLRYNLGWGLN